MHILEWIAIVRASLEIAKEFRDFIRPQKTRIKTERERLLEEFHERQLRNIKAVRLIHAQREQITPRGEE